MASEGDAAREGARAGEALADLAAAERAVPPSPGEAGAAPAAEPLLARAVPSPPPVTVEGPPASAAAPATPGAGGPDAPSSGPAPAADDARPATSAAPQGAAEVPAPVPPVIRIEGLVKAVDGRLVLGAQEAGKVVGLDLEVPRGVVLGLLAPAGEGGTLLLRLLLGIDRPDAGRLEVLGRDVGRDPLGVRAIVGYVADRPTFYASLTATSLGRFLGDIYPTWSVRRYVDLLARLGLPPRARVADLDPALLARLALAAALGHGPRLLLVDVPADLDAAGRAQLFTGIEEDQDGRTVVVASSRPHEVARLVSHVAVVARGRVRWSGPVADLLARARVLRVDGPRPPALPAGVRALRWRGPTQRREGELTVLADEPARLAELKGAGPATLEDAFLGLVEPPPAL